MSAYLKFATISVELALATAVPTAARALAGQTPTPTSVESSEPRRRFNPRLHPMGVLFGTYQASLDVGVLRQWTVGPTFGLIEARTTRQDTSVYAYGLTATWYLTRARLEGGWVIRPTFYYIQIHRLDRTAAAERASRQSHLATGAVAGRQWMADNGLNFTLAAGLAFHRSIGDEAATIVGAPGNEVSPEIEASFGWAF